MGLTIAPEEMVANYCGQRFLTVISLLMIFECIISLKMLELRVPAQVALGMRAQLSCRWALGPGDVLYAVKWYKDGKEFFRHVPREQETRRKFPLPGVDVEQSDSSGADIVLSGAVSETAGRYRCEVSGERPLFPTVSEHADMDVVVLPEHGPVISGLRSRYRLGDHIKVNCTSGSSRPPVGLSWYINGEPLPTTTVYYTGNSGNHLKTTILYLDFVITEQLFKNRTITVKCLATLGSIYWQSHEERSLLYYGLNEKDPTLLHMITKADRVHTSNRASVAISTVKCIIFMILSVTYSTIYSTLW